MLTTPEDGTDSRRVAVFDVWRKRVTQRGYKMKDPSFKLEASFDDKTGQAVAVYLRVREGTIARTNEVKDGYAYADYDSDGMLLGIELLGPCEVQILDSLAENEPEQVRRFLLGGTPRELVTQ
jgi:Protein of unknown function (DUF2283)